LSFNKLNSVKDVDLKDVEQEVVHAAGFARKDERYIILKVFFGKNLKHS